MGIFDALNIGYTGLSTSQTAIDVTSHNIANVNTPGYSKQVVKQSVRPPLDIIPGSVGTGVKIEYIKRAHDEFVYSRYKSSQANLEYSSFKEDTLKEISNIFSDVDGVFIQNDINEFFNSWSDLSEDPTNDSLKSILAANTKKLSDHIKESREDLVNIQNRLNDQIVDMVNQINDLAKQIVDINKKINKIENVQNANANDLRDQRDQLELKLNKIVNISVFKSDLNNPNKTLRTDMGNYYNINIAGFNIVDGVTFHPRELDQQNGFNQLIYQTHDGKKVDFTSKVTGGKLGAIIDLRGDSINSTNKAQNSIIQNYIDDLDTFAKGLIDSVNSVYAKSAQKSASSKEYKFSNTTRLLDLDELKEGSFDVVVYNSDGDIVAKRAIKIDKNTTLDDGSEDSIVGQINKDIDDNGDNDSTNDLDDYFEAKMVNNTLVIEPKDGVSGYYIAFEDQGTNFVGFSKLHKFFDGDSAKDIDLNYHLKEDPSKIQPYKPPVDGNNELAVEMVDLQYTNVDFIKDNNQVVSQTIDGFYRYLTTTIATDATNQAIQTQSISALDKTINEELKSVSSVDMDEELTNLMKYQTAYQASAKIISTIDQMIDTLLGIKQ